MSKKKDKGIKPLDAIIKILIFLGLAMYLTFVFLIKAVYYIFSKGSILDDKYIVSILEKMKKVITKWG